MTLITKNIGRLPVNLGDYDSSRAYGRKNRCLQYGCEVESLVENNTDAPFTWDGDKTFTLSANWRLVSGNPEVWAAGNPKPASTGTTGDYPYNGMGRVVIPKNMQNIAEQGEPENIVNLLTQDAFEDGEGNPLTNTVFVIQYDFTLGEDITIPANCVLEFDGGSISGAYTITGTNTAINAGLNNIFSTDVIIAGTWNTPNIYAIWFGVVGDGGRNANDEATGTDNRSAFMNISNMANGNKHSTIEFEPDKVYSVSVEPFQYVQVYFNQVENSALYFKETSVDVNLNGSTIQLMKNANSAYNIICLTKCSSSSIKNGKIIGDAYSHNYTPYHPTNKPNETWDTFEWCHGVNNDGSICSVENVDISYCCGDGIISGYYYDNGAGPIHGSSASSIDTKNCNISYCGRQGITLGDNIHSNVEGVEIHHIGTYGNCPGFLPMSGIDIEADAGNPSKGPITIKDCYIHDTTKYGIDSSGGYETSSLLIDNCTILCPINTANVNAINGLKTIRNCKTKGFHLDADIIENCEIVCDTANTYISCKNVNNSIIIADKTYVSNPQITTTGDCVFNNCTISGFTNKDNSEKIGFTEALGASAPLKCTFNNCTINADFNDPGIESTGHYLKFNNCVLNECFLSLSYPISANYSQFNECVSRQLGSYSELDDTKQFNSCKFYNEDTTLTYDAYGWACVASFAGFYYDMCTIQCNQPIFVSNYASMAMKDKGKYTRCLIRYDSETAFYGTIKDYVDCTVSGIS